MLNLHITSIELGLEEASIIGQGKKENVSWVELANGCVCCTVRHELQAALETLVQLQRDKWLKRNQKTQLESIKQTPMVIPEKDTSDDMSQDDVPELELEMDTTDDSQTPQASNEASTSSSIPSSGPFAEDDRPLEYVLIETDGLAKPGPIAASFWVDEALGDGKKVFPLIKYETSDPMFDL